MKGTKTPACGGDSQGGPCTSSWQNPLVGRLSKGGIGSSVPKLECVRGSSPKKDERGLALELPEQDSECARCESVVSPVSDLVKQDRNGHPGCNQVISSSNLDGAGGEQFQVPTNDQPSPIASRWRDSLSDPSKVWFLPSVWKPLVKCLGWSN